MRLLIDGYNVLHQSGLLGKGRGGVWLERGRKKLLDLLRDSLDPALLPATHIVFDAYSSSSIATEITSYQEIKVHFSLGYENADALIEKLIREHHAPKSLTVVSSDHRIQRCAKAHRCRFFDSATWLDDLPRSRSDREDTSHQIEPPREQLAAQGLSNYEVQLWLKEFGIAETLVEAESAATSPEPFVPVEPEPSARKQKPAASVIKTPKKGSSPKQSSVQRKSPPQPHLKSQGKQKQIDLDAPSRKTEKPKPKSRRQKQHDLPRARKRATRQLPEGFKFPENDATEE
jgi:uncharacterized protein